MICLLGYPISAMPSHSNLIRAVEGTGDADEKHENVQTILEHPVEVYRCVTATVEFVFLTAMMPARVSMRASVGQ